MPEDLNQILGLGDESGRGASGRSPDLDVAPPGKKVGIWVWPVAIGIAGILTPVTLLLAAASGGAGHGHYVLAKWLFPYTMLSTIPFRTITDAFVVLAFLQYPVYGCLIAHGIRQIRGVRWVSTLAGIHLFAVALCFLIGNASFE